MTRRLRVCFVLPSLNGGGAERAAVAILNAIDGSAWDRSMYLFKREGPYLGDVSSSVRLSSGQTASRRGRLAELRRYFRETRPDVIVSFLSYFTVLVAARASSSTSRRRCRRFSTMRITRGAVRGIAACSARWHESPMAAPI